MLKFFFFIVFALVFSSNIAAQTTHIRFDNALFHQGDQPYVAQIRIGKPDSVCRPCLNDGPFDLFDFEYSYDYFTIIENISLLDSLLRIENQSSPELLVDVIKDSSRLNSKLWRDFKAKYKKGSVFITIFDDSEKVLYKYLVNGDAYAEELSKKLAAIFNRKEQESVSQFIYEMWYM